MLKLLAIAPFVAIVALACDSPGGGSGNPTNNNNNNDNNNPVYTPPSGTRPAQADNHRTSYNCSSSSDCQYWFCQCNSGSIVNSSFCDNGACLDATASCTDACTAFGSTWSGSAGGGPGWTPPVEEPDDDISNGGSCGGFGSRNATCDSCTKSECCDEGTTCGDNVECLMLWDCIVPCNGDGECLDTCYADYPGGGSDFESLIGCSMSWCPDECGW